MDAPDREQPLRSYWTPVTVLTAAFLLFTLLLSGWRIHEAFIVRNPDSPLLAVALALGIEGAAGLAACRVLQLRRRDQEQPLPSYLVKGLFFFVFLAAAAQLDHALRHAQPAFANPGWLAVVWEIVLNLLLALAYPSGLLLVSEVLPDHLRAIDAENEAWRRAAEEKRQQEEERARAELAAQQQAEEQAAAEESQEADAPAPPHRMNGWKPGSESGRGSATSPLTWRRSRRRWARTRR